MRDWDSFLPIYMHGSNSLAGMNGHGFLALLAGRVTRGFTYNFARICTRLGLGDLLTADKLKQLYTAALFATPCSIACCQSRMSAGLFETRPVTLETNSPSGTRASPSIR